MSENYVASAEAAHDLDVSEATVRRYIHQGLLVGIKEHGRWYVSERSLVRLLDAKGESVEEEDELDDDCDDEEEFEEDDDIDEDQDEYLDDDDDDCDE